MGESRKRSRFGFGGDLLAGIFEVLPDELIVIAIAVAAVAVIALIAWFIVRMVARVPKTAIQLPRAIARRRSRKSAILVA
jgi:hypothetical protein